MSCMLVNEMRSYSFQCGKDVVRSDVTPGAQWSRLASSSHMWGCEKLNVASCMSAISVFSNFSRIEAITMNCILIQGCGAHRM